MHREKSFILDCSVSASWCFADENDAYTTAVLDSFTEEYTALVPSLWYLGMINVFWAAERRKRITRIASNHFLELMESLPIETMRDFLPESGKTLLDACRLYGLTSYDAVYLQNALESSLPLATKDRDLRNACAAAGVPIFLAEPAPGLEPG